MKSYLPKDLKGFRNLSGLNLTSNQSKEKFYIRSEVGKLRKVIAHRPLFEMRRLTTTNTKELLIDDLMEALKACKGLDAFVNLMRAEFGIRVSRVHEFLKDVVVGSEGWAYSLDRKDVPNDVNLGGANAHQTHCS